VRQLLFLVPGQIETPTGGYVYDRRIVDGLRRLGWSVQVHSLDTSFPFPTPAALEQAAAILSRAPDGTRVLVDGLAFSAMPQVVEREATRLRLAALVHLPLAADITRDAATRDALAAAEQRALRAAWRVIVTGTGTTDLLARYHLDPRTVVVVEPGTNRVPIAARAQHDTVTLLSVATLHPGKGHDTLLHALAPLGHLDWRLICAGSLTRHPETAGRIRGEIARLGLGNRVTLRGELDENAIRDCYDSADVFVLATLQETYGMAVAEALAHGLPVVATATGAIPGMLADSAGILVPAGDSQALGAALVRIIADRPLRYRLAEGAARAAHRLPTWEDAANRMAHTLAELDAHG
jgi:glycosyltransferase involved in cell wall biosynthesis